MSDMIIVSILQCIFSCSPTAYRKAALCRSSSTTVKVETHNQQKSVNTAAKVPLIIVYYHTSRSMLLPT